MNDLKPYYQTVAELLWNEGLQSLSKFCNERYMSDSVIDHDNWDGGIDTYDIVLEVPVSIFSNWQSDAGGIEEKEKCIEEAFETAVRGINAIRIAHVTIRPNAVVNDERQQIKKPLSLKLHFEVQRKYGKRSDYLNNEAFNEGQVLTMGIKPDDMYSFKYTYHPEYDTSLYAIWNVHVPYQPLSFMRTIGIVLNKTR